MKVSYFQYQIGPNDDIINKEGPYLVNKVYLLVSKSFSPNLV